MRKREDIARMALVKLTGVSLTKFVPEFADDFSFEVEDIQVKSSCCVLGFFFFVSFATEELFQFVEG